MEASRMFRSVLEGCLELIEVRGQVMEKIN